MFFSTALAVALLQGPSAEALTIARYPMDTARAARSLQFIRDGDAGSKILLIEKWSREHAQTDRYLRRLGYGVGPQPERNIEQERQRDQFRDEVAETLALALRSESREVSKAALEAMLRMQMVSLDTFREEPAFVCGTGMESTTAMSVESILREVAKKSPALLLPYLSSPDIALRFGACDALQDISPRQCDESMRGLLSSKDETVALAAAVSMTWLKPNSTFVDPMQPLMWSRSPVVRAWLLHSIEWPDELDGPYENLTPLEKQVMLDMEGQRDAILRKGLAEFDLNLVRTASVALGDRLASEEADHAISRLLQSNERADFIAGVTLSWKHLGKSEAIRRAMEAPNAVRPQILSFLHDMESEEDDKKISGRIYVPSHFEIMPRLLPSFEFLREIIEIDLKTKPFDEWRPILTALIKMKNPIARQIGANCLREFLSKRGVSPTAEMVDLAKRVGLDPSPSVSQVAFRYEGLTPNLLLTIFDRSYARIDDEARWGFISRLTTAPAPVADTILKRIAGGANPQDAEMAREAIAYRKQNPVAKTF